MPDIAAQKLQHRTSMNFLQNTLRSTILEVKVAGIHAVTTIMVEDNIYINSDVMGAIAHINFSLSENCFLVGKFSILLFQKYTNGHF